MFSDHYCDRCGEDAWFFYRCNGCGNEFCEDCATRQQVIEGLCPDCWQTAVEDEEAEEAARQLRELRTSERKILPCMRSWYERNVIAEAERQADSASVR